MAFVFQQERNCNKHSQNNESIGPGTYIPFISYILHQNYKQKPSYAPFLSTSNKKKQKKHLSPGPGHYKIQRSIADPLIQTITNNSSVIVKFNSFGTSGFRSNSERFKQGKKITPGPGSCNRQQSDKQIDGFQSKKKKLKIIKQKHIAVQKKSKINSIPEKVIKLFHNCPEQEYQEGRVGPGTYQTNVSSINKKRGISWNNDQSKRFCQFQKVTLGPGKYNLSNKNTQQYKNNPSSFFISDTVRSFFDNIFYKTNLDYKAKMRMKQGFKDVLPGPGYYNANTLQQTQKIFPFQFFGSTVPRFKEDEEDKIGPGQYKFNSSFDVTKIIRQTILKKIPKFRSFLLNNANQEFPGPGTYKNAYGLQEQLKKKFKKYYRNNKFGSTTLRFNNKLNQIPGPGSYFKPIQTRQEFNYSQTQPNSFFKSTTIRECNNKNIPSKTSQLEQRTPFAEYQIHNHQIGLKIIKQKIFLQNLKKIDVQKPGFDSSFQRFSHYKLEKKDDVQNAQNMYETTKSSKQKDNIYKGQYNFHEKQNASKFAVSKEERFRNYISESPAVGTYDPSLIQKKSFNIKYNK